MLRKIIVLVVALIAPLIALWIGLELKQGCPPLGSEVPCYGPIGEYWTIFGYELRFQKANLKEALPYAAMGFVLALFPKQTRRWAIPLALVVYLWTVWRLMKFEPIYVAY